LLATMSALLEEHFDVLTAKDGISGIQNAKLNKPDLIVSDIMMPEASGYELVQELKSTDSTRHIPIMLLTALGEDERKIEGFDTGADEYLVKPFKFSI